MIPKTSVPSCPSPGVTKVIELSRLEPSGSPISTVPFNEAARNYCSEKLSPPTTDAADLKIEACSTREGLFLKGVRQHPFIEAVHQAFAKHYPLVLSPSAIWLLIAQGLASHINANSEALRPRIVGHSDKMELRVRRDDFRRGSQANDWPRVFDEFSTRIRENLKFGVYDIVVPKYSTTTADDVAVTQIVLMDAVQSYFSILLQSLCGIPEIHLEGSASDWEKLLSDARALERFDVQWWTAELIPVLEQFVGAAHDDVDKNFWVSLYKYREGSGGPYVDGWINVFFPYLNPDLSAYLEWPEGLPNRLPRPNVPPTARPRDFSSSDPEACRWPPEPPGNPGPELAARYRGMRTVSAEFPTGLSVAPFKWDYFGTTLDMRFVGGFVGVRQNPDTLALRPELGWVVAGGTGG